MFGKVQNFPLQIKYETIGQRIQFPKFPGRTVQRRISKNDDNPSGICV